MVELHGYRTDSEFRKAFPNYLRYSADYLCDEMTLAPIYHYTNVLKLWNRGTKNSLEALSPKILCAKYSST